MAMKKTVTVNAKLGESFTIESEMAGHKIFVDQPKEMGGDNMGPNPLQYLFLSLGACIASIGRIVANQKSLPVRGMDISVTGDLNAEFLMGMTTEGRAGFGEIVVSVSIDADMTDEEKEAFLHEVDARCPVSDNILAATPVKVQLA